MTNEKILLAYATRAGSTAEVSQAIAQVLSGHGMEVDTLPVKEVRSLSGYRAVILGSAIRMGGWLPEAVEFANKNSEALMATPTAFFAVHLMNIGDDAASRTARAAYLDPVRKAVTPKKEAFFAGVGNLSKLGFFEKLISKMVKSPEGDFRDWQAIHAWAEELSQPEFYGAGM